MGTDPEKIRVIINGAEPLAKLSEERQREVRQSLGFSDNDLVVGMFARFEECKGHVYLLKAAAIMSKRGSRVKLLLCGKGSQEQKLKELARESDLEDRIVFAGFCADISPYMNAVDVNVNCSVGTETSSRALSEGMSVGKPAVVSDYGGNGAMVEHGVSGLVVPRADPTALAEALLYLERDPARLREMGAAAEQRYRRRFTPQRMTRELEDFYIEQMSLADKPAGGGKYKNPHHI